MKNIYRIAASLFVLGALAWSCQKPAGPGPEEGDDPIENAIEFAGSKTELNTVLVDVESSDVYLAADAGIKTLEELSGREYVLLNVGDNVEASDEGVLELDLTKLPEGFVLSYCKAGETVVSISSADHSAITEGTLKAVLNVETEISGTLDFSMKLVSGETFRGNMTISESNIVLVIPEEPSLQYPSRPMTFVVDGLESPIGKVFVDTFEEYILVTMTPDANAGSYEEVVTSDNIEYLQFMALPSALNRDLDLIAERQSIFCWDNETETTAIYPGEDGNLVAGKARLDYNGETGEAVLKIVMELSDGTVAGAYAEGVLSEPAPEKGGEITVNGQAKPVRAAFYMEEGGTTALYFTRSEVYSLDEMTEDALDYFLIMLPDAKVNGEESSLISATDDVVMMYVSNVTGDMFEATGGNNEGSFCIQKIADGEYSAKVSVTFDEGTSVNVEYTGVFVPYDYVPEDPNEFTFNGETQAIQSALLDKSDAEIWHIYLSPVGGLEYVSEFQDPANDAVHITTPKEVFELGSAGFSTFKETLKFEYGGKTWKYDEKTMGTLEVNLDGSALTVDFTTYGELKGHYEGQAIIVE